MRDNPFTRSIAGVIGMVFLTGIVLLCMVTLPWTMGAGSSGAPLDPAVVSAADSGTPRYNLGEPQEGRLAPWWWPGAKGWGATDAEEVRRLNALVPPPVLERVAAEHGLDVDALIQSTEGPAVRDLQPHWPNHQEKLRFLLGTDLLGRSLLVRVLAGGGISLGIGIAAAFISVLIGTLYGSIAAYIGGKTDAVMMRIVDILYGLPYILLVVLLAVASESVLDEYVSRSQARGRWVQQEALRIAQEQSPAGERRPGRAAVERMLSEDPALRARLQEAAFAHSDLQPRDLTLTMFGRTVSSPESTRRGFNIVVLLVAIGGVSWLTMARVVRGQVLSLKAQPFMEAARAMGVPLWGLRGQFLRHLLPNLLGPIIVYATLTVPQAILQESFLSFLGIGVKPPLPSWGNLASEGLKELNTYKSNWWLLVFPCIMLGTTLLALNFVGEGLREALDPKRARR
jgi:oligopeptide transport system permease protein